MEKNNLIGSLKQRENKLDVIETNHWEEKVLGDLNCDELLFIENDRNIRGDSNQIVKNMIKMKRCKID